MYEKFGNLALLTSDAEWNVVISAPHKSWVYFCLDAVGLFLLTILCFSLRSVICSFCAVSCGLFKIFKSFYFCSRSGDDFLWCRAAKGFSWWRSRHTIYPATRLSIKGAVWQQIKIYSAYWVTLSKILSSSHASSGVRKTIED